jgi:penicillin amidase
MIVVVILVLLALALALLAAGLILFLRRPLPQTQGMVHLAGLKGEVEVIRDRWGVPHIYADSAEDLFFAQGYVHAQDRLWQMELQRRAGSGRLSEITGEATLEIDRFFRVVGLNRAAQAEALRVEALDEETRCALESYVAGVNAYLSSQRGRLPVEFSLLRFQPEPWQVVDVVYLSKMIAWNLSCNWASELLRARLTAKLGADLAADLEPPYPAENPPLVRGSPGFARAGHDVPERAAPPNGWGSEALRDALRLVEGILQEPSISKGSLVGAGDPSAPPGDPIPPTSGVAPVAGGSNQWVVAGSRSATGWPLLANDTHLQLSMPAGWYEIHLVGGGYNVTGVSFPGAPGVLVGHNEHCAWGLTTAWQDAQDLYIEKLNPDNPHQYEYLGKWHDADVVCEEIHVKGRDEPVVQEVVVTRHGPIISGVISKEASLFSAGGLVPLALRWVASEPGHLLRSVLRYNRAKDWDEFRAALGDWSAPAHNFVYADVKGNIGYLQAGWVPVRAQGYGLAPVPGWTEEYEWRGYLPLDQLPQAYNPESGWLAAANNLVVDGQYPHFLSADLENPCRAHRIVDLVTSKTGLTASDFARFQLDTCSAQAERFVRHLLTVEPVNERERRALAYLEQWDARLAPDSIAASIYQVARLRALHLLFDGHLDELASAYIGLDIVTPLPGTSPYHGRSIVRLLDLLDGQEEAHWLCSPPGGQARTRQDLLHQALQEALELLHDQLGSRMDHWTWGRLNRVHFAHPVGAVKPLHLIFNRGPYPAGGDHDTLLRAIVSPQFPFQPITGGDAVRFVADLNDWEQCRIVIPGGQSGHVASRHYADLIPLWREGRLQPMPFGRGEVERHAEYRLTLLPEA